MKKVLLMITLSISSFFVAAQTLYVDSGATSGGNGGSWITAFTELSDALDSAWHNPMIEKIYVAKGTYKPNHKPYEMNVSKIGVEHTNIQITNKFKTFHIRAGLELYGSYPNGGGQQNYTLNKTILSGLLSSIDTAYHVIYIDSSSYWALANDTTIVDGFIIENGMSTSTTPILGLTLNGKTFSNQRGGGLVIRNGLAKISHSIIQNNIGIDAGGIYSRGWIDDTSGTGFLELSFCTIKNNRAQTNAGAVLTGNMVKVLDCDISENSNTYTASIIDASGGAFIGCYQGEISRCTFVRNKSVDAGGLVVNGDVLVRSNYFSDNQGFSAVTIVNAVSVINNVIYANHGNGVSLLNVCNVINNTVVNNSNYGIRMVNDQHNIVNNILVGNAQDYWSSTTLGDPAKYATNNNCFQNDSINFDNLFQSELGLNPTGNLFNVLPLFVDSTMPLGPDGIFGTGDDGLQLMVNSPCINTGNNSLIPTSIMTDVTGAPRIENSTVDMGAYESSAWQTGIGPENKKELIQVYPNPTIDRINLTINSMGTLIIRDELGRMVKSLKVRKGKLAINISNLSHGVYYLELKKEGKKSISKFIKR